MIKFQKHVKTCRFRESLANLIFTECLGRFPIGFSYYYSSLGREDIPESVKVVSVSE